MIHLTDDQLNEYIDGVVELDTLQSMELHLKTCAGCSLRLNELRAVFTQLEELRQASPLSSDLKDSVLSHLPEKRRLWTPVFAAQCGAALGIFLWLSTEFAKAINHLLNTSRPLQFSLPDLSSLYGRFDMNNLIFAATFVISESKNALKSLLSLRLPLLSIPYPSFSLGRLSTFQIPFSGVGISLILVLVLFLWLMINFVLLHQKIGVRK
jgi:hypothetical protein